VIDHMFHLPLPILEKILRPIIIYVVLIVLLRIFGKRELAQLNPFDLVVLLSLSNTVQNALIGDDNSVTGGVVGALTLLSVNWLVVRLLYSSPKLDHALEGKERILIQDGKINPEAMRKELLTNEELLAVVHKQGLEDFCQVQKCVLEPNGSFYVEGYQPSGEETRHAEVMRQLEELNKEVQQLRALVINRED
jgi:uncharacterized membrane protein YcaP (DUF421 family)